MGKIFLILFAVFFSSSNDSTITGEDHPSIPVSGYRLFWNDEFTGHELNLRKWNYRGTGRRADATISEKAVSLDGKGRLIMEARSEGDSIITGMIATEHIFETRYGYFECRASLTSTPGIFPAFWLQSPAINNENGNPGNSGAEIDIFEYFPHAKKDFVAHTLHWGGYGNNHKVAGPVWAPLKKTKDGFHVFGLEWTPGSYTTFVDGTMTYTGQANISHVPEFLVLSLGINKQSAGPLDITNLPDRFIVDYVRVYKKK
jgi:beta-glucanase (GH16 family)